MRRRPPLGDTLPSFSATPASSSKQSVRSGDEASGSKDSPQRLSESSSQPGVRLTEAMAATQPAFRPGEAGGQSGQSGQSGGREIRLRSHPIPQRVGSTAMLRDSAAIGMAKTSSTGAIMEFSSGRRGQSALCPPDGQTEYRITADLLRTQPSRPRSRQTTRSKEEADMAAHSRMQSSTLNPLRARLRLTSAKPVRPG